MGVNIGFLVFWENLLLKNFWLYFYWKVWFSERWKYFAMACANCKCGLGCGKVKYSKFLFSLPILRKFEGFTFGARIWLNPKVLDKPNWYFKALVLHENVHVAQWRKDKFLFLLKYLFSKKKRLEYELEAFGEEVKVWPPSFNPVHVLSERIVNNYGFKGLDIKKIEELLLVKVNEALRN